MSDLGTGFVLHKVESAWASTLMCPQNGNDAGNASIQILPKKGEGFFAQTHTN